MPDTSPADPIFVSVKEAASMLGIDRWSIYRVLNHPDSPLDARYFGKRRLISVASLRNFAESLPTTRPEESA